MYAIVDCNNFFASCERLFRPDLEGKPIVVLSNNDGCIISRSAEAKKLGVKMGVPYFEARALIEHHGVHVFSSNYILYGDLSNRVMQTLHELVEEVEQYSIDEAFLQLPEIHSNDPETFCRSIKATVEQWTGMPVSIGIAPSKTLAKVANRISKKYKGYKGVFILDTPERTEKVLEATPVNEVWGVGRRLTLKLCDYGIYNALQLRNMNDGLARKLMGVTGLRTVQELRGIPCYFDDAVPEVRKGILSSRSFGKAVDNLEDLREAVSTFTARAAVKLRRQGSAASAVGVFVYTDKSKRSWSAHNAGMSSLSTPSDNTGELIRHALSALQGIYEKGVRYKKAGVMFTGIVPRDQVQLNVFDSADHAKQSKLMPVFDRINLKMGPGTLLYAVNGISKEGEEKKNWLMRSEKRSPCYTTRWDELMEVG